MATTDTQNGTVVDNSALSSTDSGQTSTTTPVVNTGQPNPTIAPTTDPNAQTSTTNGSTTPANLQPIQAGIQQAQKTAQSIQQQIADKYKAGLATAQNSGTQPPATSGMASAAINSTTGGTTQPLPTSPAPTPVSPIQTALQNDPGYQQLVQGQQQYLSSANQGENLTQQYTDLSTKLGLPDINTQLINMNSVIDGTEQDIRNEVTSAGGFATDSQVMALATARNKMLVQNYNNLLQTKTDIENQINTQMGFAKDDQATAQALATEQLNYNNQIASYTQKFTQNAQDALTSMQSTEGWDGILKAAQASGDPTAIQRINDTMGNDFDLNTAAQQDAQARADAATKTQEAEAQAQATLASTKANTANIATDNARANATLAETIRHNQADEANATTSKPDPLAPGETDKSKVMSKIQTLDQKDKATIDMDKLSTDPTYFYWVKNQIGA